ncbi:MAG: GAF domain-containing protein [bacterium]|nr:MAG: GAF domain-containing protein [bacterium]
MKRGERFVVNVAPELDSATVDALIHKLNVLLRASMIYSLRLDTNSALRVIVDLAHELAHFEKSIFYLFDEDDKSFYPAVIDGFPEKIPAHLHRGNAFLEWTVENALPVRVEEVRSREIETLMEELGCRSLLSMPILVGNSVRGVLQLFSAVPNNFPDDIVRFLWILILQLEGLFHKMSKPAHLQVDDFDPFTGLPMRSRFDSELDREFLRSRRNNRSFSLFLMEIDDFQEIKEKLISIGGGIILRGVVDQVLPMIRKIDTFARYSDTSLALLLPETDLRHATLLANRIRSRIANTPLSSMGTLPYLKLTISIGVAGFPQALTVNDLLAEAQKNLLLAHEAGGNQAVSRYSAYGLDEKPVSLDLQELLDTLGSVFDMENLLTHLVEFFSRISSADRVSILLMDNSGDRLVFKHGIGFQGFEEEIQRSVLAVEDSICGQALKTKQPLLVDNVDIFMPDRARHGLRYSSPSFMSIPLIFEERAIGVINFSNRRDRGKFTQQDLANILPHVTAMAKLLAGGRRFNAIQKDFLHYTADVLLNIAENKSPYLRGHSDRVSEISYRMARSMKLHEDKAMRIANAARFHDLGRIAVDESILGKPGPLDSGEASLVRQHPLWSARILQSFPNLEVDIPAVRTHHERYDGKGYPDGLMGEEIPVGGRILAVTDAYDAMIHDRPFRPAMSPEDALTVLDQKSGSQFDKRIVKVFRDVLQ